MPSDSRVIGHTGVGEDARSLEAYFSGRWQRFSQEKSTRSFSPPSFDWSGNEERLFRRGRLQEISCVYTCDTLVRWKRCLITYTLLDTAGELRDRISPRVLTASRLSLNGLSSQDFILKVFLNLYIPNKTVDMFGVRRLLGKLICTRYETKIKLNI